MVARISKNFFTKNRKSDFFIKNPKSNKKILAGGRGAGGVWPGKVIFFFKRIQV